MFHSNSRALRALTPRMSCICIVVQLGRDVNDLYLHMQGQSCTWAESTCIVHSGHSQWAWLWWPTKIYYLWRLYAVPLNSIHTKTSFSPNSTCLLCLLLAQMPRSPDLAIFVFMTMTTRPITLLHGHVRAVIWYIALPSDMMAASYMYPVEPISWVVIVFAVCC